MEDATIRQARDEHAGTAREYEISEEQLEAFRNYLTLDEKCRLTIGKYLRDVRRFIIFLGEKNTFNKSDVLRYKNWLASAYAISSANSMLAALNSFFSYQGWHDCRVKAMKLQKSVFYGKNKELKREEYLQLIAVAEARGDTRLALLLQTICSAGLRVSELSSVTAEAAGSSVAQVCCKGKNRLIMLPNQLCRELTAYCREQSIRTGPIFITRGGRPLDRSNIWKMMKRLSRQAQVEPTKVFPHSLRHLFARTFYDQGKDIIRLADVLGHRSVDTTRIYTASSGAEHSSLLNGLQLLPHMPGQDPQ